ncbi:IclR family transcriptional regulator [Myceligenerans halotolerans]
MKATTADPTPVQSVDRAVHILELLGNNGPMGVSEVSRHLGVHRSTAFRLLATLEGRHLVEQESHRGLYRLGLGLLRLAGSVSAQVDLVRDAQACCDALAAQLNETTNASVLDGEAAINITQALGSQLVAVVRDVGQQTPLHATSTGKVLLAHTPEDVQARLVRGKHERFTPATITEPEALRSELATIREQGWAASHEEWQAGTNAVAVPVRGQGGNVVAALSVTAPNFRMPEDSFPKFAEELAEGAADLGRRLGGWASAEQ